MMDFTQYGTLPHNYGFGAQRDGSASGFGAQKGGGSSGGTGADAKLTLETLRIIEAKQKAYANKRFEIAWSITAFTAARKAADAEYAAAARDLDIVRALLRQKNYRALVVGDLPKAVRARFASLLPGGGKGTGAGKGAGTGGGTGGGKGGGRGVGWEAALAAQAGAPPATPTNEQAAGQGAGTGTGEIIAGVSNTTLLLLGGGALLAFVLVRRKGAKAPKVFKGT